MKIADYLANYLVSLGVTDAFGIPGAVIFEMLYAFQRTNGRLTPHLSYHEQGAGFSALGYAQVSCKIGVAYATRGPGFTNLITSITDAYCDSVPVLFLTSHALPELNNSMRIEANQEIDTCRMVENVTKYARKIDKNEDFQPVLEEACRLALSGRKGPVFLDVAAKLWKEEIVTQAFSLPNEENRVVKKSDIVEICNYIAKSKRPIILIGDGVNQANALDDLVRLVNKVNIPVLSSRYAHDVIGDSKLFYGYIGSFGVRYANFILSKADLILSLGNRLNFPIKSASYHEIPENAKILRVEIDKNEFSREIPNANNYQYDLKNVLRALYDTTYSFGDHNEWLNICDEIKQNLWNEDVNEVVLAVDTLLKGAKSHNLPIINDVGNNEFWISRANAHSMYRGRNLYSKTFATLGCALPKSIGAHYASNKPVICFVGDQGFQMNIQELQLISSNKLPVLVVIMNNNSSGMIRDKENKTYGYCIHSTTASGYCIPDIASIAKAYNIKYVDSSDVNVDQLSQLTNKLNEPIILNLHINETLKLEPFLPIGRKAQDMEPELTEERYNYLNRL